MAGSVEQILCETGLRPECLEVELTESLTLDDSALAIEIMRNLKRIGVSLSLDDFGIGSSSLSYLRKFPIDRLKIDRSFLQYISSDPAAARVIRSILDLGENLGLSCIGEGVETRQQLEPLCQEGCAEMQGFLFSRALPAEPCHGVLHVCPLFTVTLFGQPFDRKSLIAAFVETQLKTVKGSVNQASGAE